MQLSKNFTLFELIRSYEGERKGIDNTPSPYIIGNLQLLCNNILQPIRDHFGPVIIKSGYRCPALNSAVGGSSKSDHVNGLAADIECPPNSNYSLAKWCKENLKFNQLILEFYTPGDPMSGWVHISYGTKQQTLTAVKGRDRTLYKVGLVL